MSTDCNSISFLLILFFHPGLKRLPVCLYLYSLRVHTSVNSTRHRSSI
ncbi:hypothetical protein COO91_02008 [Nostoc flagelliforme CCNUN1]|uniref:Uncharacterized protein n=1 Tax=Nostoc flagelliforme CCNUN1 TaxID=2038116 RepID=A0A2K8SL19_9NOSO|nr:hypothetical protein COO91_02008 [Nostoc flagelliforme CCNUN1]